VKKRPRLRSLVAVAWIFLFSLAINADDRMQTSNFSIAGQYLRGADDKNVGFSMPRTEAFFAEDFSLPTGAKGNVPPRAANRLVPVEVRFRSNTTVPLGASDIVPSLMPVLSPGHMQTPLPRPQIASNLTRQQVITIAFLAVLITLVVVFVPRT